MRLPARALPVLPLCTTPLAAWPHMRATFIGLSARSSRSYTAGMYSLICGRLPDHVSRYPPRVRSTLGVCCIPNMLLLERKETKMSDLATAAKKRPVQIDLSTELIAEIERLAAEETLTRTAWMRRLLHGAVKAAREQREAAIERSPS